MTIKILTQSRLKELLIYDPDTGVFTRKVKHKRCNVGDIVGAGQRNKYLQCSIDNKLYKLHRLAWLYMYDCWPSDQIDHVDHNPRNNAIANLRDVSSAQNHQNRARKTKSASGYLGVTWHKRDKRWQAYIELKGKSIHLGQYSDLDAAIFARKQAELKYHLDRP
jgi:hypothetical protein